VPAIEHLTAFCTPIQLQSSCRKSKGSVPKIVVEYHFFGSFQFSFNEVFGSHAMAIRSVANGQPFHASH
jgi:hypothetical protein